jgi:asparagine synthase (glutamine-hydrolysing)
MALQKWVRHCPAGLLHTMAAATTSEKLRKMARLADYPASAYFLARQIFSPELRQSLMAPRLCEADWRDVCFGPLDSVALSDEIAQISFWELRTYMLSTLLRDTDQMGMAHGLEIRVPLLDRQLVETMLRLPSRHKLDSRIAKPLLVHAAGDRLPPECVSHPKRGFVLPFDAYFQHAFQEELTECFRGGGDDLFDGDALARLWNGYAAGRVPWGRIWLVFTLRNWLRRVNSPLSK